MNTKNGNSPSIIVVGAGIAGLSTGIYARMNGYVASIFEHHSIPGGLCTAWKRGDYTVDGCIHWLMGTRPGSFFNQMWNELGALDGRKFVYPEEYFRMECRDGRTFVVYSNLDRLARHMKELSPKDSKVVDELVAGVRAMQRFDFGSMFEKAPEIRGPLDKLKGFLKMLPILSNFRRWKNVTIGDFAERFQDPLLKEGIGSVFLPSFPSMFMFLTLANLDAKDSGYPLGGSLPFARAVEDRFVKLGGTIHYQATVTKILVEGNRAVGVRLKDGREHRADVVVSAADLRSTVFDLLGGQFIGADMERCFSKYTPVPGIVYIALGINRTFDSIPASISGMQIPLEEPLTVGGEVRDRMTVNIRVSDPSSAPAGKTIATMPFLTDYDYWQRLSENPDAYRAEKKAFADEVIRRLERRFPGLREQVEMVDVATPVTFRRYTRNHRGSIQGWLADSTNWRDHPPKTLPGLSNFYLAGQWVEVGGGLPPAAFSGRHVIQILCKRDGKRFTTRQT